MKSNLETSFARLYQYINSEQLKGYDPYDILHSWIPFHLIGKIGPRIATQIHKRNPINLRPCIGIGKQENPKAIGLFLQSFSILYSKTKSAEYLEKAKQCYYLLKRNFSRGYSGYCWGYDFPWAGKTKYVNPYIPSSVVTGTVVKGLWEYYKLTGDSEVADIIYSAANFVLNDLHTFEDQYGIAKSYTPIEPDICYNASLLAGEVLAIAYNLTKEIRLAETCKSMVEFVISRQLETGMWHYSESIDSMSIRSQIDFHQGFILDSIYSIQALLEYSHDPWTLSLRSGAEFYKKKQFRYDGQSFWRLPKKFPVEIHNQSQGIITFEKLKHLDETYLNFSHTIAEWTIDNMQSKSGYFYYQKHRSFTNKISYIRWSQAWMFLALTRII